ncbi:MAG: glycogen synthase GlgA [Tissierellia bacterium]|nr:glycogen synthase GlgA [Tissierellia bacterium]
MKVLYCTSEAEPFIKTGGLADVAGSLPLVLKEKGVDIRVVLPLYSAVKRKYKEDLDYVGYFYTDLDYRHQYTGVYETTVEGVTFYFIDNEFYFARNNIYGEGDDAERFIYFSKACTQLPRFLDFKPDIIHSNDWHTALVNVFVADFKRGDEFYHEIKTVFTIHNLKYQGIFDSDVLQITGLSPFYYNEDGLKYYDAINFMKGGIVYSDFFTTVSGTYALEIKYPFFGEGLEGVIDKYSYKLKGIVNGIDYNVWNPEKDPYLAENFSSKCLDKKKENKRDLQRLYGLPEKDVPLIGMCSRLVEMKGLELVRYIMDELLTTEEIQFVVLGTGDYVYEEMFRYFEWKFPEKMSARIYYNSGESHKIYGGCDFLLMPSLAEPCGISQLIAMRYGTVPIVRETGGLKDTVPPYNEFTKEGLGFTFKNINAHDLLYTIRRGISFYNKDDFRKIQEQGMKAKNNWDKSAKEYLELYKDVAN